MAELKVSQRARDAAAPNIFPAQIAAAVLAGNRDDHPIVQAFARFEQAASPITDEARPCEGSITRTEDATFDQRWCLASGRYCKHADMRQCVKPAALPLAPREGWQEEVGELRKALEQIAGSWTQFKDEPANALASGYKTQRDMMQNIARAALSRTGEVSRG